jgi:hypothetical protein
MHLELTDDQAAALLRLLNRTIADDRYPLSPRIKTLRDIRSKLPGAFTRTAASQADNGRGTESEPSATRRPAAPPTLVRAAVMPELRCHNGILGREFINY